MPLRKRGTRKRLRHYSRWHDLIDEMTWLLKVSYGSTDDIKKKHFRLDSLFASQLRANDITLGKIRAAFQWTSWAKSVFHFDVQGSVAYSTHTGLPWLLRIREEVGDFVYFLPFDGWQLPTEKCVIVEVYPSIFRNRYPREDRTADKQDACAIARWLKETDERGFLDSYFDPPLTDDERKFADLEGWILGIM